MVIDTSNPLDFSQGFPPTLFVSNTDSLAEQLQRGVPAGPAGQDVQHHGQRGDDQSGRARSGVDDLRGRQRRRPPGRPPPVWPRDLGWTDVFDLGDLTAARGLEMWMPLWMRLYGRSAIAEFNIKLVR